MAAALSIVAAVVSTAGLSAQETQETESAATVATPASEQADAVVPESPDARAAADAAEAWLRLVDVKDHDAAWTSASSTLQTTVSPQQLKNAIRDGRRGLDSLVSRTLVGVQELRNPPNAMPGDYVVLLYRTRGTDDWQAIETVIPRREDGAWLVSGYLVRKE